MKFSKFCTYLEKLEGTSLRNEMTVVLAELFKKLAEQEIKPAVYMLQGRIAPSFTGIEFNFSIKLLLRSFAKAHNLELEKVQQIYKQKGDIGLAGAVINEGSKSKSWDISYIFGKLQSLAGLSGKNSQADKQNLFAELIKGTSENELKYLARIVVGNLRVGFSDKTILDSISWTLYQDKSLRSTLDYAYGVRVDLGLIAEIALIDGKKVLEQLTSVVGTPVAPKLVEREKSTGSIFKRLGPCFIQPKYDGLRMQIHYSKKGWELATEIKSREHVAIFSRNMENITHMFPDIVAAVQELHVESVVLDSEAIGFDPKTGKLLPFQETITRKRKSDILEKAKSIPLKVFVFDVLFLNGRDMLKKPLNERISAMEKVMSGHKNINILAAETIKAENESDISLIFQRFVKEGLEGVIAKTLTDTYEPGTRNYVWIKLKAASQSELVDTVDAVALGYYLGTGVRAKFGIGAILIGIYDDKEDKFKSLTKVGTGFKDEQWGSIKTALDSFRMEKVPDNVMIDKKLVPDVICKPEIVVVVDADSISRSKTATGLSLRFPRLKEFDRKDKNPEQVTSVKELTEMFNLVKGKK